MATRRKSLKLPRDSRAPRKSASQTLLRTTGTPSSSLPSVEFEDYEAETTYPCGTTHFPRVFIMNGQYGNDESRSYELKRTDSKIAFIKRIEFCR